MLSGKLRKLEGCTMTMLMTRIEEIFTREGFMIEVTKGGKPLANLKKEGILGPYEFRRKLGANKTVQEWKTDRFEKSYPGYSCNVLKGDGATVPGQTLLSSVRKSY
jgi:hypothetical protein